MNLDKMEIRTEEEYENALHEIERLWGAPYGSPDAFAGLVEAYEKKTLPLNLTEQNLP